MHSLQDGSSSPTGDYRPKGPETSRAEAAGNEEERKSPAPAARPAALKDGPRRTRGGVRHNRNHDKRVQCQLCHRWVNQCKTAQAQHRSSKFCLTWRFYNKGFKWQDAERMTEEAVKDSAFLKRLNDEDTLQADARPRGSAAESRWRGQERSADSRARSSGRGGKRELRSRSRRRRGHRRPTDSRDSRDHKASAPAGARRSRHRSRGPHKGHSSSARPKGRRERSASEHRSSARTREQVSASEETEGSATEESETAPKVPPKKKEGTTRSQKTAAGKPAAEYKGGEVKGRTASKTEPVVKPKTATKTTTAVKGKPAVSGKTAASAAPAEETEYEYYSDSEEKTPPSAAPVAAEKTAGGAGKAACKSAAVPAAPASGGATTVDRATFVSKLLATAIQTGLQN